MKRQLLQPPNVLWFDAYCKTMLTLLDDDRLACTAFTAVFRRRQTKHRELLFWLQRELAKPAQAAQGKRLAPVANGYTMQQ